MTAAEADVQEIRDSVRDVLLRESTLDAVRADAAGTHREPTAWDLAVDLGWPALAIGEEHGGLGFGVAVQAAVLEQAGYALFSAPLVSAATTACVLTQARAGGARDAALAALAEGTAATVAFGDAVDAPLLHVPDADHASFVVVVTPTRSFLVHRPDASLTGGPGPDPNRPVRTVTTSGTATALVDLDPSAAAAVARVLQAAELVGVAARAVDVAVLHAQQRTQFGRPIGAFQAVKHRLADGYVALERARSLVEASARGFDEQPGFDADADRLSRMAKAAAGDAALGCVRSGIQVLGALGTTAESELPWLLRRARVGSQLGGDSRHHYAWLGHQRLQEAS